MPGKTSDNLLRLKDMNGKNKRDVDDELIILPLNDNEMDHDADMPGKNEMYNCAWLDNLDISLGGRTVSRLSRLSSSRLSTRTFNFNYWSNVIG